MGGGTLAYRRFGVTLPVPPNLSESWLLVYNWVCVCVCVGWIEPASEGTLRLQGRLAWPCVPLSFPLGHMSLKMGDLQGLKVQDPLGSPVSQWGLCNVLQPRSTD